MSQSAAGDSPRGSTDQTRTNGEYGVPESIDASENAFQRAIAVWRGIDLSKLQKQLDNEASEIITNQRDDLVERKDVAQKTKDFRKLSDADKLVEYKTLLKSYQQFIDHISNHRKSTESLFLNIYNHLSEAPDPYPLLEATIDSLVSSEDVQRLTAENNSLRTTNARLSSQAQNLEGRIEEVKRDASRKEEELVRQMEKAEDGFQALLDEKSVNWDSREKAWQDKFEHQEPIMKEMKASYEVNMRMGKVSEEGNDDTASAGASLAELELISTDLDRTTMRLQEMESRNEQLRLELSQIQANTASTAAAAAQKEQDEQDALVARLESTNSNLIKKIENLKKENEDKIRENEKKLRSIERDTDITRKEGMNLKNKLNAWSDYEDIKRELEVLKTIEFSTGDDDEDENETEDEGIDSRSGKKDSLEQLLLARNKKLGNELTVLRVSHQDLSSRLDELQKSYKVSADGLISSRQLVAQLEDDLQKVQTQSYYPSAAMSVAGTYTSRYAPYQAGGFGPRGSKASPTSSIISGRPGNSTQGSYDQLRAAGEIVPAGVNGPGILPMITAQRDRYKQRITQLEEELQKSHDSITSLRQEIASLQKDNLQLYEKTRYMSSYARQPSISASPSSSTTTQRNNLPIHNNSSTSSGLSLDRYRAAYESNISPFEQFRTSESARVLRRMNPFERVINSIVRLIMRRRLTRNLFVGYCLFLHVVLFILLLWEGEAEMGMKKTGLNVYNPGHEGIADLKADPPAGV